MLQYCCCYRAVQVLMGDYATIPRKIHEQNGGSGPRGVLELPHMVLTASHNAYHRSIHQNTTFHSPTMYGAVSPDSFTSHSMALAAACTAAGKGCSGASGYSTDSMEQLMPALARWYSQ